MSTAVDFHSHILPGVDDGSKDAEESVAMLQMEWEQGIRQVVATPHFYPQHDQLNRFLDRRKRAVEILKEKTADMPQIPKLHIGAEVHFFQGISDCEELPLLTVNGGRYILIEMPHSLWTDEMYHQLERIYTQQNLHPIIAHLDRYLKGFRTAKVLQRLADLPVLVQANAEFFLDKWTVKTAVHMLQDGKIHLLGSDCHNLTSRKPNLEAALKRIEKRSGEKAIAQINHYEQTVLSDEKRISHTTV